MNTFALYISVNFTTYTYIFKTCFTLQERPRPEYVARAPTYEKNPITGVKEPYFPDRDRLPRIISGFAVISIMVGIKINGV